MKSKLFRLLCRRHYMIIVFVLTGIALFPAYNFIVMADIFGRGRFDITVVIPFMAVTVAILTGFLLLPLLNRLPSYKKQIIVSAVGTLVFVGLDLLAQHVASNVRMYVYDWGHNLLPLDELVTSRMMPPRLLDELARSRAPVWDWLPPYGADDYFVPIRSIVVGAGTISWQVRAHYYVFSIILVVVTLNWLINLTNVLTGKKSPSQKFLILQGVAVLCYAMAYLFVRVVEYKDFATSHITWGSVLNSAICFMLAAIAVGLYSGSLLRNRGRIGLIIHGILSVVTVLALYLAQFVMLFGGFYAFGSNVYIEYAVRTIIVISPGIIVYLLLKYVPD